MMITYSNAQKEAAIKFTELNNHYIDNPREMVDGLFNTLIESMRENSAYAISTGGVTVEGAILSDGEYMINFYVDPLPAKSEDDYVTEEV